MDFSPLLDTIYTKDQAVELMKVLDSCVSCGFKNGNQSKQLKEVIPHDYYAVLKPFLKQSHWTDGLIELRNVIAKMPIITLYTPYRISEKTSDVITEYVREHISSKALIETKYKDIETPLAIEWKGQYGEF